MNETTFKRGDRVRISGISWGRADHQGKEGEVIRADAHAFRDGYDVDVRVDGENGSYLYRPADLTKVEPEPAFATGDRVRINGFSLFDKDYRGKTGTVVGAAVSHQPTHTVNVEPDEKENGHSVHRLFKPSDLTKIEEPEPTPAPEPTAAVGDRVRVIDVGRFGAPELNGRVGVVEKIESPAEDYYPEVPIAYCVALDGDDVFAGSPGIRAECVEVLAPEPEPEEPPVDIRIDPKRAQAVLFASGVLGADAVAEEITHLAEFVLDEHIRTGVGTVIGDVVIDLPEEPLADWEKELLAATTPAPGVPASLIVEDQDGDAVTFQDCVDYGDGIVFLKTIGAGSGGGVYLTAADIDRVVEWLIQIKAAKA